MTNKHLTTAVPRRNYPAIFAGSRQSVEHTVCGGRNLGNRLFAIALLAQVSCHHADHVGAVSTNTTPESLRTPSSSPGLLAIFTPSGKSRGMKLCLCVLSTLKKSAVISGLRTLPR